MTLLSNTKHNVSSAYLASKQVSLQNEHLFYSRLRRVVKIQNIPWQSASKCHYSWKRQHYWYAPTENGYLSCGLDQSEIFWVFNSVELLFICVDEIYSIIGNISLSMGGCYSQSPLELSCVLWMLNWEKWMSRTSSHPYNPKSQITPPVTL